MEELLVGVGWSKHLIAYRQGVAIGSVDLDAQADGQGNLRFTLFWRLVNGPWIEVKSVYAGQPPYGLQQRRLERQGIGVEIVRAVRSGEGFRVDVSTVGDAYSLLASASMESAEVVAALARPVEVADRRHATELTVFDVLGASDCALLMSGVGWPSSTPAQLRRVQFALAGIRGYLICEDPDGVVAVDLGGGLLLVDSRRSLSGLGRLVGGDRGLRWGRGLSGVRRWHAEGVVGGASCADFVSPGEGVSGQAGILWRQYNGRSHLLAGAPALGGVGDSRFSECGVSVLCNTHNWELGQTAVLASGDSESVEERVRCVCAWIRRHVDISPEGGHMAATGVLIARRGSAGGVANLFVGMARTLGIPARRARGLVRVQRGQDVCLVPYEGVQVWHGEWRDVDLVAGKWGRVQGLSQEFLGEGSFWSPYWHRTTAAVPASSKREAQSTRSEDRQKAYVIIVALSAGMLLILRSVGKRRASEFRK